MFLCWDMKGKRLQGWTCGQERQESFWWKWGPGWSKEIWQTWSPRETQWLLYFMLGDRAIPDTWIHATIVIIYKKKKWDASNVAPAMAALLLVKSLPVSCSTGSSDMLFKGYSLRHDHSTIDMILQARHLLEKPKKHQNSMCFTFIYLHMSFDTINCETLWEVLWKLGCPPDFPWIFVNSRIAWLQKFSLAARSTEHGFHLDGNVFITGMTLEIQSHNTGEHPFHCVSQKP